MLKHLSVLTFIFGASVYAFAANPLATTSTALWLENQKQISTVQMQHNISRPDTVPGTIVAATTRENPNYYYHWVRDAALVVNTLLMIADDPNVEPNVAAHIDRVLRDYTALSRQQQMTWTLSNWLGDPKFNPDGTAFQGPWGRPQIDGPPLRAISLIHWARQLFLKGEGEYVRRVLYDSKIPTETVIKGDLEYAAHHWFEPSFDLWEEVQGHHFYTLMVSMSALFEGADFADSMGDPGAASYYRGEARKIQDLLHARMIDVVHDRILTTVNQVDGLTYKVSQLDSAIILALLHARERGGFLKETEPLVLHSVEKVIDVFRNLYAINVMNPDMAPAIGRYPEDVYGGSNFNGGNPWVLTTFAAAEFYYKRASELAESDQAAAIEALKTGDSFTERVRKHTPYDGALSEQFSRVTGYMTSVENLTWSYASSITAAIERNRALSKLEP